MKALQYFFLFCLFMTASLSSEGQYNCDRWYFGLHYQQFQPIQTLWSERYSPTFGGDFEFFYNLNPYQPINFHAGMRLAYGGSRGQRDELLLSDPIGARGRSSLYNAHLDLTFMYRAIFMPNERISPYFELTAGGRLMTTTLRLRSINPPPGYEERNFEQLESSGAWTLGVDAGLLIKLNPRVDLDLRGGFTHTSALRYADLDTYVLESNQISYQTVRTPLDLLHFAIGFRINFTCMQDQRDDHVESSSKSDRRDRRYNRRYRTPRPYTPPRQNRIPAPNTKSNNNRSN